MRTHRVHAVLFVALALAFPAARTSGQTRDRPVAKEGGTGRVLGRVVAADSGRPIARARITLTLWKEARPVRQAATDSAGRFAFDGLPAGRFVVSAARPGLFLDTLFGQTTATAPGRPIAIADDQTREIEIRMFRAAAVAGRIVDEDGEPMPYAYVMLQPKGSTTGRDAIGAGGIAATTNDRGEYRLFGIVPGDYILSVTLRAQRFPGSVVVQSPTPPMYFPGTVDRALAATISVAAGQEIANPEMTAMEVRAVTVSGTVATAAGPSISRGNVVLEHAGLEGVVAVAGVGSIRNGTFTIGNVPPGQYILRARYSPVGEPPEAAVASTEISAALRISVGSEDVTGLALVLAPGTTISGRVVIEGSTEPSPSEFRVTVESGEVGRTLGGRAGKDGRFSIRGVESGSRHITASGPPGWSIKAVLAGDRDVTDLPLDVVEGQAIEDVRVIFTDRSSRLSVTVKHTEPDPPPVSVVVYPSDSGWWHPASRRVRTQVALDEPAHFDGLPPGEYLVAAVANVLPDRSNPAFTALLEQLRADATRIVVGEVSAAVTVGVRTLDR